MRGSLNQWRVAEIIRVSQREWREGYELGKGGDASLKETIDEHSVSFRDGYYRGWEEFFGIPHETKKPNALKRLSHEEVAKEQRDRGYYLGKRGVEYSTEVLAKCHPSFREGYYSALKEDATLYEYIDDDKWRYDD